jgi:hypothetical protein
MLPIWIAHERLRILRCVLERVKQRSMISCS